MQNEAPDLCRSDGLRGDGRNSSGGVDWSCILRVLESRVLGAIAGNVSLEMVRNKQSGVIYYGDIPASPQR